MSENRQIRSYQRAYTSELTLHSVGNVSFWRPIPARGLAYFAALLLLDALLSQVPGIGGVLLSLGWEFAFLVLPFVGAAMLAMARIEGRRFHVAIPAWVRSARRGQFLAGGYRRVDGPTVWKPRVRIVRVGRHRARSRSVRIPPVAYRRVLAVVPLAACGVAIVLVVEGATSTVARPRREALSRPSRPVPVAVHGGPLIVLAAHHQRVAHHRSEKHRSRTYRHRLPAVGRPAPAALVLPTRTAAARAPTRPVALAPVPAPPIPPAPAPRAAAPPPAPARPSPRPSVSRCFPGTLGC